VLAPKLKQSEGPALFLVSETAGSDALGALVAHRRMRLRKWETRRAWAGRALVALTFPMAYLLVMISMGTRAAPEAARLLVWLWAGAAAFAGVCAEAVWRHRTGLDRLETRRLY
jgi:peptidoglycan/LPS O-acetylase OafA/YrhL